MTKTNKEAATHRRKIAELVRLLEEASLAHATEDGDPIIEAVEELVREAAESLAADINGLGFEEQVKFIFEHSSGIDEVTEIIKTILED